MYNFFGDLLTRGNRIAFKYRRDGVLFQKTYVQYHTDICACIANLKERIGIIENKHIGILLGNCYEYLVLLPAIIGAKGVAVPLNIQESADNLQAIINDADIDCLIVNKAEDGGYGCEKVIVLNDLFTTDVELRTQPMLSEDDAERVSLMIYTSGTTGQSKGVMITNNGLFNRKKSPVPVKYHENPELDADINAILVFPLYHVAGIGCWLGWCSRGFATYVNENPGDLLNEFKDNKIDFSLVPPSLLKLLAKKIKRGKLEELGGISAIGTGGAPIERELIELFVNNGIEYFQLYGMTETAGFGTYNSDTLNHIDSVGKASPGVEIMVIDGELCIKTQGASKGYYKDAAATEALFSGEYLHTGDLGFVDDDGYVYITGRKKNLIILSGGENVSPEELENKLYKNPLVKECIIYEKNDKIVAQIYASESDRGAINEFISEMNKKLPIYKRIYSAEFRNEEFEKTAIGKIRRTIHE